MTAHTPRSGAEVCRALLEIPDDVRTALELQAFVEVACDIQRAAGRGEPIPDPLPQPLLRGYVAAERAFLGDDAGPPGALEAFAAEMSSAQVVVHLDARIKFLAKASLPANAARQAVFQRAVRLWLSKREHLWLELCAAELVTPVDRRGALGKRHREFLSRLMAGR